MANVNKTYQKLSLKDHIQKLPDTYVGDIDIQCELFYTISFFTILILSSDLDNVYNSSFCKSISPIYVSGNF